MRRYYFDYSAATPVDPAVEKAMRSYWSKTFGNPGALHWFGQEASAGIFEARSTIAASLGCHYKEIVFTGSATEANNIALRGAIARWRELYPSAVPKIIVSAIEHESVLETCNHLKKNGAEIIVIPVTEKGIINTQKLKAALDSRTVVVSAMYANNEIGTIQPIAKISEIIRNFREVKGQEAAYPLLHTDAVQAFNYLDCNVGSLGVDLLTLSGQKIYGPKGIGALYARQSSYLSPIITGGGQEWGLRPGTENVPAIVGLGKAIAITDSMREKESRRLTLLRDYCWQGLKKIDKNLELNGDQNQRLPNNLNVYVGNRKGKNLRGAQDILIALDLAGFAVSNGAACRARVCLPSYVIKALGFSDERAANNLRITFGRLTNKKEIDLLLTALKKIYQP